MKGCEDKTNARDFNPEVMVLVPSAMRFFQHSVTLSEVLVNIVENEATITDCDLIFIARTCLTVTIKFLFKLMSPACFHR